MKVFITGIDGFTGKYLESHLASLGYEVYGTTLKTSQKQNYFQCDIRDKVQLKQIIQSVKPDYVFHLAAISFVGEANKSLIYDVNVIGTQNLLNAFMELNLSPKKIIAASSATVYGNQNSGILDESMCPAPVSHYGYSKLVMEHLVSTYFNTLNIITTRPFNYTGYGHAEHFVIPKIVTHFAQKKPAIELGNIDVAREFNDIRTVINIYTKLMLSDARSIILNVCTGHTVKLVEVLEYMKKITAHDLQIDINPQFIRKNEIPVLRGSTKKLNSVIDTSNQYTIYDTLLQMYKGYTNG